MNILTRDRGNTARLQVGFRASLAEEESLAVEARLRGGGVRGRP